MADTKSKTIYLELPAVFEWAKVFPENMDKVGANNAYAGTSGAYTVDLILTKDVFQQLEDAGSQKTPSILNKDGKWMSEKNWRSKEQGKSYMDALDEAETVKVKLVRKHDAPYTYGGPPQVAHADGTPWGIQEDGLIGNGSKGIAYVSVYEAGGLKGTRLDGLQIMELVEPPARDPDEEYEPRSGGFKIPNRTTTSAAPKAKEAPVKKAAAKKVEDIEDIIPF
jgi:hypothetical protein